MKFGQMKLPSNFASKLQQVKMEALAALKTNGNLHDVYLFICERLNLLGLEVLPSGSISLDDVAISDNQLFCILKKDLQRKYPDLTNCVKKTVVTKTIDFIREQARKSAIEQGATVKIVFTK